MAGAYSIWPLATRANTLEDSTVPEVAFAAGSTAVIVLVIAVWTLARSEQRHEKGQLASLGAATGGLLALLIIVSLFVPRGPQIAVTTVIGLAFSGFLVFAAARSGPWLSTPEARRLVLLAVLGAGFVVLRVISEIVDR